MVTRHYLLKGFALLLASKLSALSNQAQPLQERVYIIQKVTFDNRSNQKSIDETLLRQSFPRYTTEGSHIKWPEDSYKLKKIETALAEKGYETRCSFHPTPEKELELKVEILQKSPRVRAISYQGISRNAFQQLKTPLRRGAILHKNSLLKIEQTVREHFLHKGYPDVQVNLSTAPHPTQEAVKVTLKIKKGKRCYISTVSFKGNQLFPSQDLRDNLLCPKDKKVQIPQHWLPLLINDLMRVDVFSTFYRIYLHLRGPDTLDEEAIKEYATHLTALYTHQRHLDAKVAYHLKRNKQRCHVTFHIQEGPKYQYEFILKGNTSYTDQELKQKLALKPEAPFDAISCAKKLERLLQRRHKTLGAFTVQTLKKEEGKATIEITLQEAYPPLLGSLKVNGSHPKVARALLANSKLVPGTTITTQKLVNAQGALSNFFKTPPQFRIERAPNGKANLLVDLPADDTFRLLPGILYTYTPETTTTQAKKSLSLGLSAGTTFRRAGMHLALKAPLARSQFTLFCSTPLVYRNKVCMVEVAGSSNAPWSTDLKEHNAHFHLTNLSPGRKNRYANFSINVAYDKKEITGHPEQTIDRFLLGCTYAYSTTKGHPFPRKGTYYKICPSCSIPNYGSLTEYNDLYAALEGQYSYYRPLGPLWTLHTYLTAGVKIAPNPSASPVGQYSFFEKPEDARKYGIQPITIPFRSEITPWGTHPPAALRADRAPAFASLTLETRHPLAADSAISLFAHLGYTSYPATAVGITIQKAILGHVIRIVLAYQAQGSNLSAGGLLLSIGLSFPTPGAS